MASRKIPERMTRRICLVGEAPFFCLLFFGPAKKSESLAARRVKALLLSGLSQAELEQDQMLSSADAAEFISFAKRQKKRNQRKTLSRRSSPTAGGVPGFFDSPSMARSKNAAHPCAARSGSAVCNGHSLASRSQSRSKRQSQSRSRGQSGSQGQSRKGVEGCAVRVTSEGTRACKQ